MTQLQLDYLQSDKDFQTAKDYVGILLGMKLESIDVAEELKNGRKTLKYLRAERQRKSDLLI